MVKTALVLSAGGMFGAYQAGAWQALAPRFRPDVLVGTSAGALNAWAISGGASPDALIAEWLDTELEAATRPRLSPAAWRGFLDSAALHRRIRRLASDYEPKTEIGVVAVEWMPLRPRLFRNGEIDWRHLAASCAALSLYEQIRIDGKLYTDGGLLGALPLWAAARMGAARVIAVNTLPRMPSAAVRAVVQCFRGFARTPAAPAGIEIFAIEPNEPLGSLGEAIFWKRACVERWIERGERDARRAVSSGRL